MTGRRNTPHAQSSGTRVAVLVEEQYQELEVWYPYYRLKEAGHEAVLLGQQKGKVYKGKFGYPAEAEAGYADAPAAGFAGVVVPGGFAPDFMRRYPEPARFVRDLDQAGKAVAAICHGGWVLCSAKILQGRAATSFSAIQDDLIHAGARWVDRDVVVDRNLVTSRKPDDLPAFCRELLKLIETPVAAAR